MSASDSNSHPFDIQYLKTLYEDLNAEVKARGEVMGKMETHMATTNLILQQLKDKNDEQDAVYREHALRIHKVEMVQAGCSAPVKMVQYDRELKRLNAFMDLAKRSPNNDIDTGMVNVHEQRLQAAAEAAIRESIPLRHHFIRMLPWMIVIAIFCVVVTTIILMGTVIGRDMPLPNPPSVPYFDVKTNSSSHGVSR